MSLMNMLYQTYENNQSKAGKAGETHTLSIIAHMLVNAQLEIQIDTEGNFIGASVVDKEDARTLIPVSEKSAGRAGMVIAPHALSDFLSYIAGDYAEFIDDLKESKKCKDKSKKYIEQLDMWRKSEYTHPKVKAIHQYVSKSHVVQDLIQAGIFKCDESGLLDKGKIAGQTYDKVMIRFAVLSPDDSEISQTWMDTTLMNCYTKYYFTIQEGKIDLCFITGKEGVIANNHPKGIVQANYGAKLISANDTNNFTFRGRFLEANEACTVSYEASQKAHNALSWILAKQGTTVGSQDKRTYVCWNPYDKYVPDLDDGFFPPSQDEDICSDTEEKYRIKLYKAINGCRRELDDNDDIVIAGFDAATTGRLSVTYYNELKASDFIGRLQNWNETCFWYFSVFKGDNKPHIDIETPFVKQIVLCSYGVERDGRLVVSDKVLKEQCQRIYYCILDGYSISKDIINQIVNKASTPLSYKVRGNYEKVLSTACALIAKYYNKNEKDNNKRRIHMELDCKCPDRSYLFGRLLAIAERIEQSAMWKQKKLDDGKGERTPNAIRLQAAFVNHPMYTWGILMNAINPYFQKLEGGSRNYYSQLIEDIIELLQEKDKNILNKRLDDVYLIGYYAQRKYFRDASNSKESNDEVNTNNAVEE